MGKPDFRALLVHTGRRQLEFRSIKVYDSFETGNDGIKKLAFPGSRHRYRGDNRGTLSTIRLVFFEVSSL